MSVEWIFIIEMFVLLAIAIVFILPIFFMREGWKHYMGAPNPIAEAMFIEQCKAEREKQKQKQRRSKCPQN